jgi:hypothetical protein
MVVHVLLPLLPLRLLPQKQLDALAFGREGGVCAAARLHAIVPHGA